ncbi:hypothetical protein EV643_103238 [Kribbella sp. VKM Ac-2527]|uniref:HTH cro/C1-type domain-containing protein n=1 Tax=Kribbella caucasensis TaxID=2512215 RepID=A0A4R6KPI1_9ACTN|nr:helix-turn-helix transcriptional regulator [Kribbella sp. VKM Ac-2527]TDO51499.1 hypothetical protein EV643_103238 [Kribbella sp. VKM Ac-2527]
MREESADSLRLPLSFWRSEAVQDALTSRDIGRLLRDVGARGISQTRIGLAVGLSQGRVSDIVRGTRRVARLHVLERVATGLSMPVRERQILGLAPGDLGDRASWSPPATHGGDEAGDDVQRKEFLRLALGTGAGLVATRYISLPDEGANDLRSALAGPIAHYRRMEHAVSSEHLAPAVEAHLALTRVTVEQSLPTTGGFSVLAEIAGMTGWLAADRGDLATARNRYAEAVRRAEQARNPLLTAYMVASLGQFETEAGNARIGLTFIAKAESLLDRSAPDSARAWLSGLRAVTAGQLRDRKSTVAALKLADTLTDHPKGEPVWPWVFQFDSAKLASTRAVALGRLGDTQGAIAAFDVANPHLTGPKPRALALVDHAAVLVVAGHVEEGCSAALAALQTGRDLRSRRVVNRVTDFTSSLPSSRGAMELSQALQEARA